MHLRQDFVQTDSSQWLQMQDVARTHLGPTRFVAGGNGAAGAASVANWQSPAVNERPRFDHGMPNGCELYSCSAPYAHALVRPLSTAYSTPPELARAPLPVLATLRAPAPAVAPALAPALALALAPALVPALALAPALGADLLPAPGPTCGLPASPMPSSARSSRASARALR